MEKIPFFIFFFSFLLLMDGAITQRRWGTHNLTCIMASKKGRISKTRRLVQQSSSCGSPANGSNGRLNGSDLLDEGLKTGALGPRLITPTHSKRLTQSVGEDERAHAPPGYFLLPSVVRVIKKNKKKEKCSSAVSLFYDWFIMSLIAGAGKHAVV